MRDIILTLFILGTIPLIFRSPWLGTIELAWLTYMNPHLLTWGFARGMPFAQLIFAVTVLAVIVGKGRTKEWWGIPMVPSSGVLLFYIFWTGVTTLFALTSSISTFYFLFFVKMQILNVLTLMLIKDKQRIMAMCAVIVFSVGFIGVKGGVYTVLTGGEGRVWGIGGVMAENNSLAVGLLMTIPILRFLQLQADKKWIRNGLYFVLLLMFVAVVGTKSRGALVAMVAMSVFFWWQSRQKFLIATVLILSIIPTLMFMPQSWWDRMSTIQSYEKDASAMGRIDAWVYAINVANDRPLVGGGFRSTEIPSNFFKYNPEAPRVRAAHSIWFEVLGDHGWVGLALFFVLGVLTYRECGKIVRRVRGDPAQQWASDLARMLKVSIVAYAVGGTFLNLGVFDLYYNLVALVIVLSYVTSRDSATAKSGARPAPVAAQ
ncbi:MAG: putative O-glycosylation ligase, exosortase A system-associated [Hyphomicrobiales bacterium]|nr:putative O-glycosylation ligase, exosortase A system-associated [Hyphomicrobiales bacterium]